VRVILTTCSATETESLVEALLGERLIGCANCIHGVAARYWWKDEIVREEETLLLMETTAAAAPRAVERLQALHSYAVPKILVLEPESSLPAYATWLSENVRSA
jgi:periplasmic divalent cation tolerance protein